MTTNIEFKKPRRQRSDKGRKRGRRAGRAVAAGAAVAGLGAAGIAARKKLNSQQGQMLKDNVRVAASGAKNKVKAAGRRASVAAQGAVGAAKQKGAEVSSRARAQGAALKRRASVAVSESPVAKGVAGVKKANQERKRRKGERAKIRAKMTGRLNSL